MRRLLYALEPFGTSWAGCYIADMDNLDTPAVGGGERHERTPAQQPEQEAGAQSNTHSSESGGALSRRSFLTAAAGSVAAAALTACGRSRGKSTPTPGQSASALPTVTPSPAAQSSLLPRPGVSSGAFVGDHSVYLPYVSNPEGAGAALIPQPTLTPTPPKATDTPGPPTPTPTPIATPFPPGPPSKLGLFVARNHPQIFEVLATQAVTVVKTLELDRNFVAQIKQTSPRTLIIGRIDLPQLMLSDIDPIATAQEFVNQLMPLADDPQRRQYIDGWESYNEPVASNADEMARLADFEAERTRLLAERGLRSVVGNFGTGQPPLELWEQFLPRSRRCSNTTAGSGCTSIPRRPSTI